MRVIAQFSGENCLRISSISFLFILISPFRRIVRHKVKSILAQKKRRVQMILGVKTCGDEVFMIIYKQIITIHIEEIMKYLRLVMSEIYKIML